MDSSYKNMPATLIAQWMSAIKTNAFIQHTVNSHALERAARAASQASQQRLIQALLRERIIAKSVIQPTPDNGSWITLKDGKRLFFDHLSSGRMDSWNLIGRVTAHSNDSPPYEVVTPSQLLELLTCLFEQPVCATVLSRLSQELDNSFINDTLCSAFRDAWTKKLKQQYRQCDRAGFLAALGAHTTLNPTLLLEQWGTSGHPWHPNYKTKLGLSTAQVIELSPEFAARYDVSLCALHRNYAHIESMPGLPDYHSWLSDAFADALPALQASLQAQGLDIADYIALPVHPWQAAETLPHLFASEIRDRLLVLTDVKAFTAHPTMSFRTVLPEASRTSPMVKLPVALRLTSVQRTVSPRSACMGPRVSRLLTDILEREPQVRPLLSIIPECIGIHYQSPVPGDDRGRHLSVLFRANPLTQLVAAELAIPVGSLFALDDHGQPLLRQWVLMAEGKDDEPAVQAFFQGYLTVAVQGLLSLYLLYGIAFEAHQQNSFMVMGADKQPNRLLLRDFGDIRIDRTALHSCGLDIELHDPQMTLYDDPGFVRDKLLHTTFMCHLGELILLIDRHWAVPQALLWAELARQVEHCFDDLQPRVSPGRWEAERQALLVHDWPAKSFMRMRLLDSHTDIVGRLTNPLNASANHAA